MQSNQPSTSNSASNQVIEEATLQDTCPEVLEIIFSFNNPIDHGKMRRVCRNWSIVKVHGYLPRTGAFNETIYRMNNTFITQRGTVFHLERRVNNIWDGESVLWNTAINFCTISWYKNGKSVGVHVTKTGYSKSIIDYDGPNGTIITTNYEKGVISYVTSYDSKDIYEHGTWMNFIDGVLVRIRVFNMGDCVSDIQMAN